MEKKATKLPAGPAAKAMTSVAELNAARRAQDDREKLRQLLVEGSGGCAIQDGEDGQLWPCGTCFMDYLNRIGLSSKDPAYDERNTPPDRHNEVWRAILQIRDAKL